MSMSPIQKFQLAATEWLDYERPALVSFKRLVTFALDVLPATARRDLAKAMEVSESAVNNWCSPGFLSGPHDSCKKRVIRELLRMSRSVGDTAEVVTKEKLAATSKQAVVTMRRAFDDMSNMACLERFQALSEFDRLVLVDECRKRFYDASVAAEDPSLAVFIQWTRDCELAAENDRALPMRPVEEP